MYLAWLERSPCVHPYKSWNHGLTSSELDNSAVCFRLNFSRCKGTVRSLIGRLESHNLIWLLVICLRACSVLDGVTVGNIFSCFVVHIDVLWLSVYMGLLRCFWICLWLFVVVFICLAFLIIVVRTLSQVISNPFQPVSQTWMGSVRKPISGSYFPWDFRIFPDPCLLLLCHCKCCMLCPEVTKYREWHKLQTVRLDSAMWNECVLLCTIVDV